MFYDHELLTNRKFGVATVWLVATLGAKSNTKKVTRKAILDVNVKKACTTIMEPDVPLALRLRGNLLYGVSRVYDQQCGYVLADAQRAQDSLRALLRAVQNNSLDINAGRVRPDQLILEDDPAFLADMELPPLDFDLINLGLEMAKFQQESQKSMLSPRSRSRSGSSVSQHSLLLDIQSSGIGSYQLPSHDPFQISSAAKTPNLGRLFEDEEQLILDDFDFGFDADGNIREIDAEEREIIRTDSTAPKFGRLESDSAASGRVRPEHGESLVSWAPPNLDADRDFIMQFDDDSFVLPDAIPFSPKKSHRQDRDLSASPIGEESSSDAAEAQLKAPRKSRVTKRIESDQQLEFRNSDLARWNREYLENMQAAKLQKQKKTATAQAKINARTWIFGNGIGNVGQGIGRAHLPSPLDIFSGDELMVAITGVNPKGRVPKRVRVEEDEDDERRVRIRPDIDEENIGRGVAIDDDFILNFDDSNPELGRDAPVGLDDHPSSAMPWNISASVHSFRSQGPGSASAHSRPSGSAGGRGSYLPGSHRISASPLIGRGSIGGSLLPDIQRLDEGTEDFAIDSDYILSPNAATGQGRTLSPSDNFVTDQEFEIFGPAAAVDTQTAGQSQWQKEALAREAMNFFEFVKNSIIEVDIDGGEEGELNGALAIEMGHGGMSFEDMFPPESNTAVVAAQAFHHVLTLATKNLLHVHQKKKWGEITITIV